MAEQKCINRAEECVTAQDGETCRLREMDDQPDRRANPDGDDRPGRIIITDGAPQFPDIHPIDGGIDKTPENPKWSQEELEAIRVSARHGPLEINYIDPDSKPLPDISDGSTASYYMLPKGARELQDLISHLDLNAQMGEIMRACYRYGRVAHSPKTRDIKKIIYYAQAELARLEKLP